MSQVARADRLVVDTQPVAAAASPVTAETALVPQRRLFISVRNFWFLKYYDSVLRLLAARGHRIHIVGDRQRTDEGFPQWMAAVRALAAEFPNVTYGWVPPRHNPPWKSLAARGNRFADYLRFLEPQFEQAPVLRRRAARHIAPRLRQFLEKPRLGRNLIVRALTTGTHALMRAISPTDHIEALLREHQPDAVIVSPLVTLGSRQSDVVRAARHLGIPSVFAAGSWDHLSSKARIREIPDSVLVWNPTQRREACEYHDVPAERIVVTGAQCFDEWFDRQPSRTREEFCRHVGLPADRPIVFYVCSSLFWGSPLEARFVERWVEAVRGAGDNRLREASILIRPHPKRGEEWRGIDLERLDHVRVWPPFGEPPLTANAKADYFDSLFYADAIVGLNTSAQIEGALVGRPVFTVLLPEYWDNQEGTLHFHYLLEPAGGPLQAARGLGEHLVQLADALANPARAAARNRAFIETFVRPNGREQSATRIFVAAIERIAAGPPMPWRARAARLHTVCGRMVVLPFAHLLRLTPAGHPLQTNDSEVDVTGGNELGAHERTRKVSKSVPTTEAAAEAPTPSKVKPPKPEPRLPAWAWSMRAVVYPVVSRINLGMISEERLWRAKRYEQKQRERDELLRRNEVERGARARARELERDKRKRAHTHHAPAAHLYVKQARKVYERGRHAVRLHGGQIARRLGLINRPNV